MGIFDFLFGSELADVDEVKTYVKEKLDEAADWRDKEWAELEARQQRIKDLNSGLIHLRDQTKKR